MSKRGDYFTMEDARAIRALYPHLSHSDLAAYVAEQRRIKTQLKRFLRRCEGLFRAIDEETAPTPTEQGPVILGTLHAPEDMRAKSGADTFIFTSAQANTLLNDKFWRTLMHIVRVNDAELHISRFTYNKQQFGKKSVKPGTDEPDDDLWFDPRIERFVSDTSVQITDDLVWCGELNIIPTRVDPIMGFENYGRGASVIIPHTKMHMKSIPTMKWAEARFAYTTGTVTQRNYIEKAAGQKASLHHVYGALLVEVDRSTGAWWARQLNADTEGNVYDLDTLYTPEGIDPRRIRAEVVTHGDLHGFKLNTEVMDVVREVILPKLQPKHQVFHDTIDFMPRNHHNIKDPHFLHKMQTMGKGNVEAEFWFIARHLVESFQTDDCQHHVITSNHDQAIEGWLRNIAGFHDPLNHELWLRLNHNAALARMNGREPRPFANLLKMHLRKYGGYDDIHENWNVVHEDDSLVIAGIEHGLHGHLGPSGSRGNPKNLRTVGKANTAHTHSAGIVDGVYTAGVYGNLDMGYNKGPSSWSHSLIVTYPNGKRTIITFQDGKPWR